MQKIELAIGVAVAVAVYSTMYIYLSTRDKVVDESAKWHGIPLQQPKFTICSIVKRMCLFHANLRRYIWDRPGRGVSTGVCRQEEANKNTEVVNTKVKTIYFIRHGQSVWNLTFMRPWNVIALLFRTVRLAAIELCFAFTNDTFLFDSPLSMKGINQALELSKELSHLDGPESNDLKALTHESTQSSVIFTSNLRRAQSTVVLALHDRLNRTGETIQVCNELEEVVSHADCVALSTNLQCSTIPLLEVMMVPDIAKMYSRTLQHTKGPGVSHLSVYEKMLRFNERVFRQNEDTIIVCGHSRWLRNYLGIFLPAGSTDVEYRGKKIGNVDTLKFDLTRREFKNGDVCYVVDPESVKLVYKNAK